MGEFLSFCGILDQLKSFQGENLNNQSRNNRYIFLDDLVPTAHLPLRILALPYCIVRLYWQHIFHHTANSKLCLGVADLAELKVSCCTSIILPIGICYQCCGAVLGLQLLLHNVKQCFLVADITSAENIVDTTMRENVWTNNCRQCCLPFLNIAVRLCLA